MKNWKEFKILGVSIMEERNGRTRLRIPWRWVRMGVLVGWPIAGLWVHLAYLALRAGDLDEAAGFSTGIVLFRVVMPAVLFLMGRTEEDLLGWETKAPEGREERE